MVKGCCSLKLKQIPHLTILVMRFSQCALALRSFFTKSLAPGEFLDPCFS